MIHCRKWYYLLTLIIIFLSNVAFGGNSGLAVVIIDMQYDFYEREKMYDTPELAALIEHQQRLLSWAVRNDVPVLIYEYEGFGQTDVRLMSLLKNHQHQIVTKITDGAFEHSYSADPSNIILKDWKVDTLIVSGIHGRYCVSFTIFGAILNGYGIITSSDLTGDFMLDRPSYPNDQWHFNYAYKGNFEAFSNLEEIIGENPKLLLPKF